MHVSALIKTTTEPIEEIKGLPDSYIEIEVKAPQTHGKFLILLSKSILVVY